MRTLAQHTDSRTRCWALACASLVTTATGSLAHAQDALDEPPEATLAADERRQPAKPNAEERDRNARELFERGRAAFDDGQYREAWDHFREAYLLSRRPELLYNVGQSADRMRMDREALAAFRLYLERLPDAKNKREVENRILWLEDRLRREGHTSDQPTTLDDSNEQVTVESETRALNAESKTTSDTAATDTQQAEALAPTDEAKQSADDAPATPIFGGSQPERDGWYVRMGLGLGFFGDTLSQGNAKSMGSGTLAGILAAGYDVADGAVLGGFVTFDWGLAPSATRTIGGEQDIDTANFSMFGAFVDYYLAPRRHGWHLMGGIGIAGLAITDRTAVVGIEDASGGGLMFGGGYEWQLDREWAIGGFARLCAARMGTDVATHSLFAPSVAFTAAWY